MTCTMKDLLQMTDHRHQRQGSFDQHPLIPGASGAQLEVGGNADGIVETHICQNDTFVFQSSNQRQKDLIVDVSRVPRPTHDFASVIEQPAQLHANNPAPVAFAFPADLSRSTPFTNGVDQFNPIAIDNGEESRLHQELLTPTLMHPQQALQAGAVGQPREQGAVIPCQPAIEGPKVTALKRKQQPDRDDLAGIQFRLPMFWHLAHLVIYPAEQFNDKVFGGHGSYLQQFGDYWLYEFRDLFSTSTNGY